MCTIEFFFALDRNVETVDNFYNKRLAEFSRRYRLLESRYALHPPHFDPDEVSELLNALLELRSGLRKLEWYAEVNRRGFVKILKKLDKKTQVCTQKIYLESKVSLRPFATAAEAGELKKEVNEWISKLGEDNKNGIKEANGTSIERVPSPGRSFWELPPSVGESIDAALKGDAAGDLETALSSLDVSSKLTNKFILALLQRAISKKAADCVVVLLKRTDDLHEDDDLNERNALHRLVIQIGKTRGQNAAKLRSNGVTSTLKPPAPIGIRTRNDHTSIFVTPAQNPIHSMQATAEIIDEMDSMSLSGTGDYIKMLKHIFENMREVHYPALIAKDTYGRMPLHYAASYGVLIVAELLHHKMSEFGLYTDKGPIDSLYWQDHDGFAPLHHAITGKHIKTSSFLLNTATVNQRPLLEKPIAALALAVKTDAPDILKMMLDSGCDVKSQDDTGETVIHIAARHGFIDCMRVLLKSAEERKVDVDITEKTYGWSPLFVAAAEGQEVIVDDLLASGKVDVDRFDASGWKAAEHAALRGHLSIARKLAQASTIPDYSTASAAGSTIGTPVVSPSPPNSENGSYFMPQYNSTGKSPHPQPVKSFGHRYLEDKTMILVTLGTKDTRKDLPAVRLDQVPLSHAHSTMLDSALSIAVSAQNAFGEKTFIDLPIQDSLATENPICFETTDLSKVKLVFDIVPTYSATPEKMLGRGVAILETVKPNVSKHRVSLQGGVQVPILAVGTLEVIGCVNFEFMIVTPFKHPGLGVSESLTYWKELTGPKVIGHRGLGKNVPGRKSLQLGENTLQSFISAANLGASYVEFDVQLTKDHVPVIYHDFLVGETGIDAPVHTLTLEQFLSMSDGANTHARTSARSDKSDSPTTSGTSTPKLLRRTRSLTYNQEEENSLKLQERMRHTRAFKTKGFKGNSRGSSIAGAFATLEEVFKNLPPEVGFNIELKYPMLQESENEEMDTFGIEMNSWVDAGMSCELRRTLSKLTNILVLKVVYDNLSKKKRDIIFSSFNPDICLLLSFKQPSIPILFLTEAGTAPMADIRASSLQEAIRFASRWNLLGIVSAAEPFVLCPRLVKIVKESGLVCVTYGTLNNDTLNVRVSFFSLTVKYTD